MISVIITAYKEPKTLAKQLKLITYQLSLVSLPSEILVCAPDPETQRVVLNHKINPAIKLIKDRGEGKPAALNLAFKKAQGDILILTDGDVKIDKKALLEIIKSFQNSKIGAVSGRPASGNPRNNMFGYWSHLLVEMAHKTRLRRTKPLSGQRRGEPWLARGKYIDCSGYLYAVRQGVIKKIPKNTLADDGLISKIIALKGYRITYAPKARVYVQYPDNFSDWLKQKKRSTGGYVQLPGLLKKCCKGEVCYTSTKMRGFSKEARGIFQTFKFAQTPKEFFWTLLLIFARIYLWFLIFWEIKIKKTPFDQMWQRVESTK